MSHIDTHPTIPTQSDCRVNLDAFQASKNAGFESPEKQREIEAPAERHVRTQGHCRETRVRLGMLFQHSSAGASHSRLNLQAIWKDVYSGGVALPTMTPLPISTCWPVQAEHAILWVSRQSVVTLRRSFFLPKFTTTKIGSKSCCERPCSIPKSFKPSLVPVITPRS